MSSESSMKNVVLQAKKYPLHSAEIVFGWHDLHQKPTEHYHLEGFVRWSHFFFEGLLGGFSDYIYPRRTKYGDVGYLQKTRFYRLTDPTFWPKR